jgi:hypothetical protein
MHRRNLGFALITSSFLILTMTLIVCAQAQKPPLTNQDVIKMVQAGLSESIVVTTIQENPCNYDFSGRANRIAESWSHAERNKHPDDEGAGCRWKRRNCHRGRWKFRFHTWSQMGNAFRGGSSERRTEAVADGENEPGRDQTEAAVAGKPGRR